METRVDLVDVLEEKIGKENVLKENNVSTSVVELGFRRNLIPRVRSLCGGFERVPQRLSIEDVNADWRLYQRPRPAWPNMIGALRTRVQVMIHSANESRVGEIPRGSSLITMIQNPMMVSMETLESVALRKGLRRPS